MFNDATINKYIDGDCHILALAINKLAGYSIGVIIARDEKSKILVHAFAKVKDKCLDVRGLRTIEEIRDEFNPRYSNFQLHECDYLPNNLRKDYFISEVSVNQAKWIAQKLIDTVAR